VTPADNTISPCKPVSPAARVLWIVLILATLYICYFRNLGVIGLVGPDEPRYAWIARDMAESGDWITPRLYGQPWFEKPVLYYWGAALSFKLFGVSEVTARLPSAICALLVTLAMAWLAWRVYGAEIARCLFLLLPAAVGMIGFSHAAAPDMPFAAMLSLALVCVASLLGLTRATGDTPILPRTPWLTFILFGFFLGLAVLAKGPAAIILIGGAVLLWAAFTRRWSDMLRCLHPLAIATFCATALPWYVLCAQRNPDFFRIFIIEHNFKRYLTPEFRHIQPFWYYIPILLIAFLPWTLPLLWSIGFAIANYLQSRRLTPVTSLLICWSAFCLAFFSISQSKLPGYILPAVPAIGLFLAQSHVHLVPRFARSLQRLQLIVSLIGAATGILFLGVLGTSFVPHRLGPVRSASIGLVVLGFALANLLLCLREKYITPGFNLSTLCVVPVLTLVLLFPQLAAPWLSPDLSGKALARDLIASGVSLDEVSVLQMNRGQEYSLNFYLHREMRNSEEVHLWRGYLLVAPGAFGSFVAPPTTCSVQSKPLATSGWLLCKLERVGATGE
jgi:4-amino-4-deoxy-L-arabinose transferase-like glycosyltransferase